MPITIRSRPRKKALPSCPAEMSGIVATARRVQHTEDKLLELEVEVQRIKAARARNAQKIKQFEKKTQAIKNLTTAVRRLKSTRMNALAAETRAQQQRIQVLTRQLNASRSEHIGHLVDFDKKVQKLPRSKLQVLLKCLVMAGMIGIVYWILSRVPQTGGGGIARQFDDEMRRIVSQLHKKSPRM